MRLLLLGCSGFVGRDLVPYLLGLGHQCTLVSRREVPMAGASGERLVVLRLDPSDPASWQQESLRKALAAAEGVVNLAGEPIAEKRWSEAHQRLLMDSRVRTTEGLVAAMAPLRQPPRVLVQASAVGYYGTSTAAVFREDSPAGSDFLAQVCQRWELAASKVPAGVRLVTLRIGIVLGSDGGALGKMLPVFRLGFGGPVGSGQQWMSWIHRHDLVRLIATALEDPAYSGTYNAVAPQPSRMGAFASELGRVLGRPSLLPVPGPLLQLLLGDGAQVVLEGQQVLPARLQVQGFQFRYPDLSSALVAATSPAPR